MNQNLIEEVSSAIQLALNESKWAKSGRRRNPKVVIRKGQRVLGESGIRWTVDLAVIDEIKKRSEPYAVVTCLDSEDRSRKSEPTGTIDRIAAFSQDLRYGEAIQFLVVRPEGRADSDSNQILPFRYDQLFDNSGVITIIWNPKNTLTLVRELLYEIRRRYNGPVSGLRSVNDIARILAKNHPALFVYDRKIEHKSKCVEILKHFKEQDPNLRIGEIITNAVSRRGISDWQNYRYLSNVEDDKLARILRLYWEKRI
jgi:hypothetical protein